MCHHHPNSWDLKNGKRGWVSTEMFRNFLKLTQHFNALLACGYPVSPLHLHASSSPWLAVWINDLDCNKVCHAYSLGKERVEDVMKWWGLRPTLTHEEFRDKPRSLRNINVNFTTQTWLQWLMVACEWHGIVRFVLLSPFTLFWSNGPRYPIWSCRSSIGWGTRRDSSAPIYQSRNTGLFGTLFTSNVDLVPEHQHLGRLIYIRATANDRCNSVAIMCLPLRATKACSRRMFRTRPAMWV